jgi:UDP-N-acetylglucosamine/UDP-N-acetylgalactosamine 4-epimerase
MYNIPYHLEKDLSTMSFLVTGGAGFIGSNLVEYLLKFGAGKVKVLDNFSTGSLENLENFSFYNSFELIKGDIRNLEDCKKAVDGVQIIFHEAAMEVDSYDLEDAFTTNDVNINGFLNVLIAAKEAGVKRIVYAASSSTYGDNEDLPKVEEKIGKPLSPYAITKYVNELYADVFHRLFGLEFIGLRYFNVFGPKQNLQTKYAAVIPKFISNLLSHVEPIINGNGKNSRDFTFVENVVQVNIIAALSTKSIAINQVYNVAYGEQTTLNELAILIRDQLTIIDPMVAGIHFHYGKERKGDIIHSVASITKAKHLLGYFPYFSLAEGLLETISAYASEHKASVITA